MKEYIKLILKQVLYLPFNILPIDKKKIVLNNFFGRGYGDNPKYIAEKIIENRESFKLVWIVDNLEKEVPSEIKKVKYGSWKAFLELATAKIWIDNVRNSQKPIKRKKQIYIQTWHGSYAPKLIEKEAESNLSLCYTKCAKRDGKIIDVMISANNLQTKQFRESFWLKESAEILNVGLPRNDIFFNKSYMIHIKKRLRNYYGISENTLIVLYMPTFRDNGSEKGYDLDFSRVINCIRDKFKCCVKLLIKFHPNVNFNTSYEEQNNIIDVSTYPDAQELMILADFMISDYSSAIFDFNLMRKPTFLYLSDINEYKSMRGLNKSFDIFPFPKAYNNDEFIENILNFNANLYWKCVDDFFYEYKSYEKGTAAIDTIKWIKSKT